MSIVVPPYVTVVGIESSTLSNHALDEALVIASAHRGEVHVLYVKRDLLGESILNRGWPPPSRQAAR